MTALSVLPPRDYIGAMESVDEVIEMVGKLLASGAAYVVDDPEFPDVYYRADATEQFGVLVDHLVTGSKETQLTTGLGEHVLRTRMLSALGAVILVSLLTVRHAWIAVVAIAAAVIFAILLVLALWCAVAVAAALRWFRWRP